LGVGAAGAAQAGAQDAAKKPAAAATPSLPSSPAPRGSQPIVTRAASLYDDSMFEDAIRLLEDGLKNGKIPAADRAKGWEILARSQVKAGHRTEAKDSFKSLLLVDPQYRPDPVRTPPDEVEVFTRASKEYQQELVEEGRRIPASIGLQGVLGVSSNSDISELIEAGNGKALNGGPEFGGSVRMPIRPRWSLDIELARLSDTGSDDSGINYEVSALPLAASIYYMAWSSPSYRINLFGGMGPMLASEAKFSFDVSGVQISASASKTGFYAHTGVEGEVLLMPRLALNSRVTIRYAKANDLDFGNLTVNGLDTQGRAVDFSGPAFLLGLRAYIGY
jgi:hypothetical protein